MKTIPISFITCIILCSCSKSERKHGQEQLRFSLHSEKATFEPDQNNDSLGLLILYTEDDQINYSSNLKKRGRKGKIPIENFLKGWTTIEKNRFEQFPPRALILLADETSKYQFILEKPYYDKENKKLVFEVVNPQISEPLNFENITFVVKGDHELTFSFRWRAPVIPFSSTIRFDSYE